MNKMNVKICCPTECRDLGDLQYTACHHPFERHDIPVLHFVHWTERLAFVPNSSSYWISITLSESALHHFFCSIYIQLSTVLESQQSPLNCQYYKHDIDSPCKADYRKCPLNLLLYNLIRLIWYHDVQKDGDRPCTEFSAFSGKTDSMDQAKFLSGQKKKNMCVYCHMLKKIKVGRSEIYIFFNFIFYNWIDIGWYLECISTLEEWHVTCFCQKKMIP